MVDNPPSSASSQPHGRRIDPPLYRSELQFRRLLDKLPAGAYTCDPEGLITYFNEHAVHLWGRRPKLNDPVDRFCGSFRLFATDGTPLTHAECWMALALQNRQGYNGHEILIERPDGERLTALAYANPIHDDDDDTLIGAVNVLVDVTERRLVEAERRRQELERTLDRRMEEERRRIGRELHDGLRQKLLGIGMLSASLERELRASGAPEAELMKQFSEMLNDANGQLRGLIHNLVPLRVDIDGLVPALRRACSFVEQWYGVPVMLHDQLEEGCCDDETANHLFHIAQEAMINAGRHAHATLVEVFVSCRRERVVLEVRDDGDGLPGGFHARGGLGVASMRNRAELIGAELGFANLRHGGAMVSCVLPGS